MTHAHYLKVERQVAPPALDKLLRLLVAVLLLIGTVFLVIDNLSFRKFEVAILAHVLSPFVPGGVRGGSDFVVLSVGHLTVMGYQVTVECTSLVILVPLFVIAAVMLAFARLRWWRFFAGLIAMTVVVLVVNTVRIALICWGTYAWGFGRFGLLHTFVGSVIGLIGFAAGLSTMVLIMGVRRPSKKEEHQLQAGASSDRID